MTKQSISFHFSIIIVKQILCYVSNVCWSIIKYCFVTILKKSFLTPSRVGKKRRWLDVKLLHPNVHCNAQPFTIYKSIICSIQSYSDSTENCVLPLISWKSFKIRLETRLQSCALRYRHYHLIGDKKNKYLIMHYEHYNGSSHNIWLYNCVSLFHWTQLL